MFFARITNLLTCNYKTIYCINICVDDQFDSLNIFSPLFCIHKWSCEVSVEVANWRVVVGGQMLSMSNMRAVGWRKRQSMGPNGPLFIHSSAHPNTACPALIFLANSKKSNYVFSGAVSSVKNWRKCWIAKQRGDQLLNRRPLSIPKCPRFIQLDLMALEQLSSSCPSSSSSSSSLSMSEKKTTMNMIRLLNVWRAFKTLAVLLNASKRTLQFLGKNSNQTSHNKICRKIHWLRKANLVFLHLIDGGSQLNDFVLKTLTFAVNPINWWSWLKTV